MNALMITTLVIFVITYALMFAFQKIRPYVALGAAALFVIIGTLGVFPEFRYSL